MSFNHYYKQQGYPSQQQAPPMAFQQTGYATNYAPPPPPPQAQQPPQAQFQQQQLGNYDQLSFLSPQDQIKFENLFSSATSGVSISPEAARAILLKSGLNPHNLARIWELSDINRTGDLLFPEFALALHLCNVLLRGSELPVVLDARVRDEVSQQVDKISFSIPEGGDSSNDSTVNINSAATGDIFETNPVSTLSNNLSTSSAFQPMNSSNTLQVNPTRFNQPQLFTSPQKPLQNEFTSFPLPALANQPTGFGFQNGNSGGLTPAHQQETFPLAQSSQSQQPQLPQRPVQEQQSSQQHTQQSTPLTQQQTGFSSQPSSQQQQSSFSSNAPTSTPLAYQATGLVPLKAQTTGAPVQRQQTGAPPGGLTSQATGFQPQTGPAPQLTGYQPQSDASSSWKPLQQQPTGLVPLNTQRTGQLSKQLQQQPTGLVPLKTQATGQLAPQQTGLVPLNSQATGHAAPLQQQPTGLVPLKTQHTGHVAALQQQPTGLIALPRQQTGIPPLQSNPTGVPIAPLQAQKTGYGQNSFFLTNLVEQSSEYTNKYNYLQDMRISDDEKKLFNKIFDNYDVEKKGLLSAEICAEIFRKSGLNREDLEKVWDLITRANQTHLDKESFQMGMWLVYKRLNGFEIPEELPESLKPSSMRILDDVKNRLKVQGGVKTMKKSSNSKVDGSRFKNNDDELVISSSRHRRRTVKKSNGLNPSSNGENLSIEDMKKLIGEKKILLDALEGQREDFVDQEKDYEAEDLRVIAELKEKIKSLPSPNSITSSESDALKAKFNTLTSRVPVLLAEIASMDNNITGLKLELFKLKNPTSVVGSGINGEVTDEDRRKAEVKLRLARRMAQLTGKPIDPEVENLVNDNAKLNEEAQKIQQENGKNQQTIKDVEASIYDISSSVLSSFNVKADDEEYKKWELGLGLEPEVQELIKSFRVNDVANKFASLSVGTPSVVTSSPPAEHYTPSPAFSSPVVSSPTTSARPQHQTKEERAAFIREQARKKMEERMAKFGIRRTKSSSSSPAASPVLAQAPEPVSTTDIAQPVSASIEEDDEFSSDDDEETERRLEEMRRRSRLEREKHLAEDE